MNSDAPLIDYEFALKQFSGNSALLLKMFSKFNEQYQGVDKLLQHLCDQQDLKTLKLHVHTIKGVSGNLGMKSLHLASKEYEMALDKSTDPSALHPFIQVVHNTLTEVKQSIEKGIPCDSTLKVEPVSTTTNPRQLLLEALKRNEFISQSKLTHFLNDLSLNEQQQIALKSAIADFDYDSAKRILG